MNLSNTHLTKSILSGLLIILLATIWWFSRQQLTTVTQSNYLSSETVTCDFSQHPCRIENEHGSITLNIDNKIIQSFEPLAFVLQYTGYSPIEAGIEFQGIEMFMGVNLLTLKKQQDGTFTGIHTLPGHSNMSMTWQALITFKDADSEQQVAFEFELD